MTPVSVATVWALCLHYTECMRHHSGVELRRRGTCGTEESWLSDMAAVVTPIFLRERSSVTEMDRENAGREATCGPEINRQRFPLRFYKTCISCHDTEQKKRWINKTDIFEN